MSRLALALASLTLAAACAPAIATATLRPDGILAAGTTTEVKIDVPGPWSPIFPARRGDFISGYLADDNYSGMAVLRSQQPLEDARCPEFALAAVRDAVATARLMLNSTAFRAADTMTAWGQERTPSLSLKEQLFDQYLWEKPVLNVSDTAKGEAVITVDPKAPEVVDYRFDRLTPPATPPSSGDRFIQGRAVCRDGTLAVASCSTGIARRETTGAVCRRILDSLRIERVQSAPAPGAPAPAPTPAPAPAQPEPAPAPTPEVPAGGAI